MKCSLRGGQLVMKIPRNASQWNMRTKGWAVKASGVHYNDWLTLYATRCVANIQTTKNTAYFRPDLYFCYFVYVRNRDRYRNMRNCIVCQFAEGRIRVGAPVREEQRILDVVHETATAVVRQVACLKRGSEERTPRNVNLGRLFL